MTNVVPRRHTGALISPHLRLRHHASRKAKQLAVERGPWLRGRLPSSLLLMLVWPPRSYLHPPSAFPLPLARRNATRFSAIHATERLSSPPFHPALPLLIPVLQCGPTLFTIGRRSHTNLTSAKSRAQTISSTLSALVARVGAKKAGGRREASSNLCCSPITCLLPFLPSCAIHAPIRDTVPWERAHAKQVRLARHSGRVG